MQRRTILLVGLLFCAVAAGAGYIVASASSTGGGVSSTLDPLPTNLANGAPTIEPTDAPDPTEPPTAEPAAAPTAAPATEPTAEPTAAPATEPTAEPTAAPPAEPTAAPPAEAFVEYTVQRGDLLLAIATQYGVTVKDILAVNDIPNPDSLRVGQVLRIPKK